MSLKDQPQRGDKMAGGTVVNVVKTAEGIEVTLRLDDENERPVGVGQLVDPQAYEYEGVDDDDAVGDEDDEVDEEDEPDDTEVPDDDAPVVTGWTTADEDDEEDKR